MFVYLSVADLFQRAAISIGISWQNENEASGIPFSRLQGEAQATIGYTQQVAF